MIKNNPVILKDNNKVTIDFLSLAIKSSKIALKLVVVPIILLFFGLFADKTLNTTPLFIVVGLIAGLFFGFYMTKKIRREII